MAWLSGGLARASARRRPADTGPGRAGWPGSARLRRPARRCCRASRLAATASFSRPQTRSIGLCSWALYLGNQSSRKRACSGRASHCRTSFASWVTTLSRTSTTSADGIRGGQVVQEGHEVDRPLAGADQAMHLPGARVEGPEHGPLGVLARRRDPPAGPFHPTGPDHRQQLQLALVQEEERRCAWPAPAPAASASAGLPDRPCAGPRARASRGPDGAAPSASPSRAE